MIENESVELKKILNDDITKEVIAFANTNGGTIYIGVPVQASWEQIRMFIKNADGDSFESARSIRQDLTFSAVESEFRNRAIEFSANKYFQLGMLDSEKSLFTNLALIMSDQCAHTIKVAVFEDPANTVFIDRREFAGSIFKQLHDTYDYLMLNNRTVSNIRGLDRFDREDYPPEAIREALLNALVHRDYSFSGSIIININREQMSFVNLGGLLPGLSAKDIMAGISQPRNTRLAQIFFRLKHIEAYGTGIRRIFDLYRNETAKPEIAVSENTFRMTLPNRNFYYNSEESSLYVSDSHSKMKARSITLQMQSILDYLSQNQTMTDDEIMALLNLKRTRAYLVAKGMVEMGLIIRNGRGQSKKYVLPIKNS